MGYLCYHHNDMDGKGAANEVYQYWTSRGIECTPSMFIQRGYDEPFSEQDYANNTVYIVDLSFTKEWERKELYVSQFIRKVLLKAIEPKFIDTEDTSYFTDLGNVLPAYLLQLTNLHYSSTNYIEDPNLHNDWVKITPIINEMQAMKMVTNK